MRASQEITQQLVRPSLAALNPFPQFSPVSGNAWVDEQSPVELRSAGVSLVDTSATEPIVIPNIPDSVKYAARKIGGEKPVN